jgi:serine/threonine protein kinase
VRTTDATLQAPGIAPPGAPRPGDQRLDIARLGAPRPGDQRPDIAPPDAPRPGALAPGALALDRYRLTRLLGHGGFATVWEATDVQLGREVAVKRIPRSALGDGARADRVTERATREARTVARLSHPAVVALFEAGADEDAFYLVSELVVGPTLAELGARGALSDRDVMEVGLSLCRALEHAHARGIVHRDIKPANVIVPDARAAGGECAKLTDFGVAQVLGEPALTRTGDVVGTLAYMAPEQARGRAVGPPADVYALGVVLYEALAGRRPAPTRAPALAARRAGRSLPSLNRARPDLPTDLIEAVDATLAPDPRTRTRLPALRRALTHAARHADDEPRWTPPSPPRRARLGRLSRGLRVAAHPNAGRSAHPNAGRSAHPNAGIAAHPNAGIGAHPPAGVAARPNATIGARVIGGIGAGSLAAIALAALGPPAPLAPGLAGLGVAAGTIVLPRLAWLAASGALCTWLALAGRPGLALLVGLLALPNAVLLRAGALRPLPALAVALGGVGLAGAFPALAGNARRASSRALLGALGAWWLCLAEALLGRRMLLGPAVGTAPRGQWESSLGATFSHVLVPLLDGGGIALGAVWALAALVLPWLVRGSAPAWDVAGAVAWAGGLALGTHELAGALGPTLPGDPTRALVLGSLAAGTLAVALAAARPSPMDSRGDADVVQLNI